MEWRTMDSYPAKPTSHGDLWGPEVLVLVAGSHEPVRFVARMEADMWLARDPHGEGGVCWGELFATPTYWYPIPDVVRDIHSDPRTLVLNNR